jgi:hypothetical protein
MTEPGLLEDDGQEDQVLVATAFAAVVEVALGMEDVMGMEAAMGMEEDPLFPPP